MTKTLHEILEYYLEQKYLKNHSVNEECTEYLKKLGKNEDEIHEILIEFDDEWTKEQLQGNGIKKSKGLILLGLSGFIVSGIIIIYLALRGALVTYSFVFLAAFGFTLFKGINEIKDVNYRKKRRAFKWETWK